jgi:hypothetical protein
MTDKDRERVVNGFRECIDNAILSAFCIPHGKIGKRFQPEIKDNAKCSVRK